MEKDSVFFKGPNLYNLAVDSFSCISEKYKWILNKNTIHGILIKRERKQKVGIFSDGCFPYDR